MQLEEEDIGGTIDLAEDEGALNSVLDEYLQVRVCLRYCVYLCMRVCDLRCHRSLRVFEQSAMLGIFVSA